MVYEYKYPPLLNKMIYYFRQVNLPAKWYMNINTRHY